MAGFGVDGIVSGLDTKALIDALMSAESGQQRLLATKQAKVDKTTSALQSLNAKVSSLGTAAKAAATASSYQTYSATSSAPGATASASASAQPGSVSFRVDAVAESQVAMFTVPSDLAEGESLTISTGGKSFTINPKSSSVADILTAINGSDAGVKAVGIKIDDDGGYAIQMTGTTTGASSTFELFRGADTTGTRLVGPDQVTRAAADAKISLTLGATTSQLTSSTNTFAGLMTGSDVVVSAVTKTDDPDVTITVKQDTAAVKSMANALVSNLNLVLSEITSFTKSTTTKAADGSSILTGGTLSGDPAVRTLQQSVLAAGSASVDGQSPSSIGIVISRDGNFTFDAEAFAAAVAKDPAAVERVLTGVAANIKTATDTASDKSIGTLTQKIQSSQSVSKDLVQRISDWDDRLIMRRATLQKSFTAMEVALSSLSAQQSWLDQQLKSLTSSNA
ncbi:flagellar hook-associated protein 2 [Flavimobilis marinus]|uniref:Flagellar hook-associated protein 2 n=1 Tax=Flavimobilis marinus TaxID=285351 RepID=A0A1I2GP90_9MICO|nr:flagellar filament capping protein FliD [Flavimobilis marinus]GHG55764.1 flagellar hook-associated protein 2 [Flavimobilis marinus]SFF19395.1 flagellar hook-associated protein 2 [Flavimobilis marinus]